MLKKWAKQIGWRFSVPLHGDLAVNAPAFRQSSRMNGGYAFRRWRNSHWEDTLTIVPFIVSRWLSSFRAANYRRRKSVQKCLTFAFAAWKVHAARLNQKCIRVSNFRPHAIRFFCALSNRRISIRFSGSSWCTVSHSLVASGIRQARNFKRPHLLVIFSAKIQIGVAPFAVGWLPELRIVWLFCRLHKTLCKIREN